MSNILSMTAFGRGEHTEGNRTWVAEIRSVNHRFCDIKIRIPRKYGALEEKIKKEISTAYSRGHIDVNISYIGTEEGLTKLRADLDLARQYHRSLVEIKNELQLPDDPSLQMISTYKEIICPEEQDQDIEEIWNGGIRQALGSALQECHRMRQSEGKNLKDDLMQRVNTISGAADKVKSMVPQLIEDKGNDLRERLEQLLDRNDLDPIRLAQEVAIMADKSDVTEELVRLDSHLAQFTSFLELSEPVGRRLDFLLQEFLREINTLASKISNADVAHICVELKNELEKMREQVQNLE